MHHQERRRADTPSSSESHESQERRRRSRRSRSNERFRRSPKSRHSREPPSSMTRKRSGHRKSSSECSPVHQSNEHRETRSKQKHSGDLERAVDNKNSDQAKNLEPNYEVSGNLDEYKHYYRGVIINYTQPVDADMPTTHWRIYPFKNDENLKPWYIHRQPVYLIGRDRRVVDIPIDHPSCSKQHAVLQYRKIPIDNDEFVIKPYILDLGSANGTFLNDEGIKPKQYYEILHQDVVKFAYSTREYVFINADIES
ncbi:Smad nuclear interacting protein 1 [Thelohanellus kitauei]|uniref:Smad nuclear interacting protein 1 n=1 Tax=Thelohanellus kitauei TaxID=669202 RepID=A0A0C2MT79_THEKT|nr:Smad nuclear interacting protein 1 [Thelohanellus kitauei]